jgi:hypothetical protein
VRDDGEDAVAVAVERLPDRLDRRVAAAAGGDADGPRAAAEGKRRLERAGFLVEPVWREVGEAVRSQRARQVDGLAARAHEAELRAIAHVTLNAFTLLALP